MFQDKGNQEIGMVENLQTNLEDEIVTSGDHRRVGVMYVEADSVRTANTRGIWGETKTLRAVSFWKSRCKSRADGAKVTITGGSSRMNSPRGIIRRLRRRHKGKIHPGSGTTSGLGITEV